MWSDELDNKMKKATESYHPAYDEKAWDKMELLLDKHLPKEKKRRRFILLLLPLLLVGTGIFFVIQKQRNGLSEQKNILKPESLNKPTEQGTGGAAPSVATGSKSAVIPQQPGIIIPVTERTAEKKRPAEINAQTQIISGDENSVTIRKIKPNVSTEQLFNRRTFSEVKEKNRSIKGQEGNVAVQQPSVYNTTVAATDKDSVNISITQPSTDTSSSLATIVNAIEEKKQPGASENKEVKAEAKTQKQKGSAGSKLSLNLSAGPDISSVGIDNPGKWNVQYGIGISYAVSKRLSIRTGFFAGRKKYSADSTEYYASYYPPKLERIDANCLVYEIPVNLVYNFPAAKKHNWFMAGGLSSYLMKRETYDYFYKNTWGQPQYYSRTYNNENSHLFSVINISGGYRYHFTDRLSLMAEPYVRIPVNGIGSGKVKLNSGGVLFSVGFKPFL